MALSNILPSDRKYKNEIAFLTNQSRDEVLASWAKYNEDVGQIWPGGRSLTSMCFSVYSPK